MMRRPVFGLLMFLGGFPALCSIGELTAVGTVRADETQSAAMNAEQERFFEEQVRPVLVKHCYECHGAKKQQAGLRLDSRAFMLNGREAGSVLDLKQPAESRLLQVLHYADLDIQMPPKGKLAEKEIAALTRWVETGAYWPQEAAPVVQSLAPQNGKIDAAAAREAHWSFRPIRQPTPPDVDDSGWVQNPVDRFVLARLSEAGLQPAPPADRRALLRRLSFDLTGLPPTHAEMKSFESDTAPGAVSQAIDRLLASPAYGERWGRHWLDVARYADSKGYVFNQETRYPFAWTYRDYVIRSFNEDKPFDRFVLEQLAADLIDRGGDDSSLAALGFLTVGRRFRNSKADIYDDRIDVITRGLMGLTVACARCHDHKYDPIPTADYYSLYGIMASSDEPEELPLLRKPERTPAYLKFEKELHKRQAARQQHVSATRAKMIAAFRAQAGDYLSRVVQDSGQLPEGFATSTEAADLRPQIVQRWKNVITEAGRRNDPRFTLWHALAKLKKNEFADKSGEVIAGFATGTEQSPPANPLVVAAFEKATPASMLDVAQTYGKLLASVEKQWAAEVKRAKAEKQAIPQQLADPHAESLRKLLYGEHAPPVLTAEQIVPLFDRVARNKHRKLQNEIARWRLDSPAAPARAMVLEESATPHNPHVFLRGSAGRRGDQVPRRFLQILSQSEARHYETGGRLELARDITAPDNPLTARVLVNRVWQHHFGTGLVTTPSDFGSRSTPPSHPELLDWLAWQFTENGWSIKWLHRTILSSATWQQSSTHPDAQAAALIDPQNRVLWRMNRQRLDFEQMRDALLFAAGRLDRSVGGRPVNLLKPPFPTRRTVYGFVNRNNLPALFRVFDFANPDASTAERPITTVPQQALFALNGDFVIEQARALAAHPDVTSQPDEKGRIIALYRQALAREPDEAELSAVTAFLQAESSQPGAKLTRLEQLAQTLLLTNEFWFVD